MKTRFCIEYKPRISKTKIIYIRESLYLQWSGYAKSVKEACRFFFIEDDDITFLKPGMLIKFQRLLRNFINLFKAGPGIDMWGL